MVRLKRKPKKKLKVAGRPPIYDYTFPARAQRIMLLNPKTTNDELAIIFGVSGSAIDLWKGKYPEFRDAIVIGKDIAASNVAGRLYERAMGYTHREERIFSHPETQFAEARVVRVRTRKHYPPDTQAALRILAVLQPEPWAQGETRGGTKGGGEPLGVGVRDETKQEVIASILNMIHPKADPK